MLNIFPPSQLIIFRFCIVWVFLLSGTLTSRVYPNNIHDAHTRPEVEYNADSNSTCTQPAAPIVWLHVHVPKTAGLYLLQHLKFKLRLNTFHDMRGIDFLGLTPDAQAQYDAVLGHFGYGLHLAESWHLSSLRTPRYTTVLRHPVDRLVSQFQFERYGLLVCLWGYMCWFSHFFCRL